MVCKGPQNRRLNALAAFHLPRGRLSPPNREEYGILWTPVGGHPLLSGIVLNERHGVIKGARACGRVGAKAAAPHTRRSAVISNG